MLAQSFDSIRFHQKENCRNTQTSRTKELKTKHRIYARTTDIYVEYKLEPINQNVVILYIINKSRIQPI